MPRFNIQGLKGLSMRDRYIWENENRHLIYGKKNVNGTPTVYQVLDEDAKDRLYRNLLLTSLYRPQEYKIKDTDGLELLDYKINKQQEWNTIINMPASDRDRLYADKLFEGAFSRDSRWETLKTLHPKVRDMLYNNPEFDSDEILSLRTPEDDTRSWLAKTWDNALLGLAKASRFLSGDLAKQGSNPIEALIYGGKTGEALGGITGTLVGALSGGVKGALIGKTIGTTVGEEGLLNLSMDLQSIGKSSYLENLVGLSNNEKVSDALYRINLLKENAKASKENNPTYYNELDASFNSLVEDNPAYRTFKGTAISHFTDDLKLDLITTAQALSELLPVEEAYDIVNNKINDVISKNLDAGFWNSLSRGALPKFISSFGHLLALCAAFKDWTALERAKGLEGVDDAVPFWLSLSYWDGVDKFGTYDPDVILDIKYDITSDEYKNFIAEGHTRNEWISLQEKYGDFKGTGISPYKGLRLSADTKAVEGGGGAENFYDAVEMSGYIAAQASLAIVLKKGFGKLDSTLGAMSRRGLVGLAKNLGTNPRNLLKFKRNLLTLGLKFQGLGIMATTSIPISVGYGLLTFSEVKQAGWELINNLINAEIDSDPNYMREMRNLETKYALLNASKALLNNEETEDLNKSYLQEALDIRQRYINLKRLEKEEDYQRLEEEAYDAYLTDFSIELVRNISLDMAFRSWIYKDATKMVKGTRPSVHIKGLKWNYMNNLGPSGKYYTSMKKTFNKVSLKVSDKFKVFNKYVENEDGLLVRNTSKFRNALDYTTEAGKNVWGGFYSNYMDDVTVGFAKGMHLHDFNNYIGKKYNLDTYNSLYDNIYGSFLAGIHGGVEAGLNPQSFKDGYVGALGSFVSFSPVGAFKYLSRIAGKEAFTKYALTDIYGNKKDMFSILSDITGNPIFGAIETARETNKEKDTRVSKINKRFKLHESKIKSTGTLLLWMNDALEESDWGPTLAIKDSKEGLGFTLLDILDDLNLETEGQSLIYADYMLKLQDLAEGNVTEADIIEFINSPENKEHFANRVGTIKNENGVSLQLASGEEVTYPLGETILLNTENGKKAYAKDRISYNAKQLLKLNEIYLKNKILVLNSLGDLKVSDNAVALLITFSLTMLELWEQRLLDLNKNLTGSSKYSEETNLNAAYRSSAWAQKKLVDIDNQIQKLEKQISSYEARLKGAKTAKSTKGLDNVSTKDAVQQEANRLEEVEITEALIKTTKETLKKKKELYKNLLKYIKHQSNTYELVKNIASEKSTYLAEELNNIEKLTKEDNAIWEKLSRTPLSKEEIMALNPLERANMILHLEDYSKELLAIIEEVIKENSALYPSFVEEVRDAGILYLRLLENKEAINTLLTNKADFKLFDKQLSLIASMLRMKEAIESEEFQTNMKNKAARDLVLSLLTHLDKNQLNIVQSVLGFLLSKDSKLTLENPSDVLLAFDNAIKDKSLLKHFKEDNSITLDTPDGKITIENVRDLVEDALNKYQKHLAEVKRRLTEPKTAKDTTEESQKENKEENKKESEDKNNNNTEQSEKKEPKSNSKNTEDGSSKKMNLFDKVDDDTESSTEEKKSKPEELKEENKDSFKKAADNESSALLGSQDGTSNIFGDGKERSSLIEFYNPLLWTNNSPSAVEIKLLFRALLGDNTQRIDELLAEYQKASGDKRPKVYFYVPSYWHNSLVSKFGKDYDMARDLPIVAIVEDSQGNILLNPNGPKYTAIGLAPTSSFINEKLNERGMLGLHRTEAIRLSAIKEGVVITDKILTAKDEKTNTEVPITSSIIKVLKHFPSSNTRGKFTSVVDIILNKLGFIESDTSDMSIFSGWNTVKDSSMYTAFRKFFLSNLKKVTRTLKNGKPSLSIVYSYQYEGQNHVMQVMTMPISLTLIAIAPGVAGNSEQTLKPLLECLLNTTIAPLLLEHDSSSYSKVLDLLANKINYAISDNLKIGVGNILIDNGKYIGLEKLETALNNAFKSFFNNMVSSYQLWSLELSNIPISENYGEEKVHKIQLNLRIQDHVESIFEFTLPKSTDEKIELSTVEVLSLIRNFLFEGDKGLGAFRGETTGPNRINGLYWNINYNDIDAYKEAVADIETNGEKAESEHRQLVTKVNAFFDGGILSLTQHGLAGFNAIIAAPFNIAGSLPSSSVTVNKDNAGELPASSGTMPPSKPKSGSLASETSETSKSIIDKILEYSLAKFKEILIKRKALKYRLLSTIKSHLSATTIAGLLYNSEFSNDNPFSLPSTVFGNQGDALIRELCQDSNRFLLFNIDYSLVDVELIDKPWKNDPSKSNKTIRIYLKGQHEKGYFELVKDVEDNYFSVHFKTSREGGNFNNKDAAISTSEERKILFEQLINAIPLGALVSTHGEISLDGLKGLKNVGRNMEEVGLRELTTKEDGSKVKVPIYRKTLLPSKYSALTIDAVLEISRGVEVFKMNLAKRGEKIYTEEIIVDGTIKVKLQDGRIIDVPNTGHLDMLTVDNLGKYHIYDMKTFLSEDTFTEKLFKNYAVQLNIYKNLLEELWGIEIDSVHIIPISLNYDIPSAENLYSLDAEGNILLNDNKYLLNENLIRFGKTIQVKGLIENFTSRVQDEQSLQARELLKMIGFTEEELLKIKLKKQDGALLRKIMHSQNLIELNLTNLMKKELELNLEDLEDAQKEKIEAIVNELLKANGENESSVKGAVVEAPAPPDVHINSELQGGENKHVANQAEPGSLILLTPELKKTPEMLDAIDLMKPCFGADGISIDTPIISI